MSTCSSEYAADIGFGYCSPRQINAGDEPLAAEAAAGHRHNDRFQFHPGRAFGNIDCLADHLLGLDQINHRSGLHSTRRRVSKGQQTHAVAAPAQSVLRRLRFEPSDQTDDLAGPDIKTRDHSRALRRNRLHFRGEAEAQHGHASPPLPDLLFFMFSASLIAGSRAAAATSDWRTVTRSGSLRSTARMSRDRIFLLRSSSTRMRRACSASFSGSMISMPSLRRRFQRLSATSTEASVKRAMTGYRAMSARKFWALRSAPLPTTSGSARKRGGTAVSSTVPSAAIRLTRPSFCHSANASRSLISIRRRSG